MAIGITGEHAELGASLRAWAERLDGLAAVRDCEEDAAAGFAGPWAALTEMGVATIALPERLGGGGGRVLDAAVALEACAHALVPGPLLGTAVASTLLARLDEQVPGSWEELATQVGDGSAVAVGLRPSLHVGDRLTGSVAVVWDAPAAPLLLLGGLDEDAEERWFLVTADRVTVEPAVSLDLTRRVGSVVVDLSATDVVPVPGLTAAAVRRTAVTLAAAEAAGIARWCLETAVEHAQVREQFGARIGSFQAIKHLCAQMLEVAVAIETVAWDAATAADGDDEQWRLAAHVAAVVALDGAVSNAQDCLQVLGGIGFTFEHDAHFRLRRVVALRAVLGPVDDHALDLADLAVAGTRRRVTLDLDGRDAEIRPAVRTEVAAVAALSEGERRSALASTGLLMPHWPAPYGRAADAVTQLVIDQELSAAGVVRPDIKIAGWALPTILAHGTDAQRERFVGPSLRGDLAWCQLFSEPEAGSDLASLRTRAVRVDGGWRLTGQKVWTSLAQDAQWAICLARTDPDVPQHRGITYFLVDMAGEGIDIRPLREMTGDALFNEVFLDDVFVPDDQVVGEPGDGWKLARTTLANERVAMAGTSLDLSAERSVALLGESSREADRVRVGKAVALSTVCTLLGVRTTLRALAGHGPDAESSVAKLLGVRNRQDASELWVDLLGERALLGGEGVDEAVHQMLLTRCLSIAGGTTQILRTVAAERILGLPR